MMRRFEVAPQARRDLANIISWYRDEMGASAALKVATTIRARLRSLESGKLKGSEILPEAPGYFRVVARKHVIIFKVLPDMLQVVRIVHGARDIPALLASGRDD